METGSLLHDMLVHDLLSNGAGSGMPQQVMSALATLDKLAGSYPDTVVDFRISTYPSDSNRYRLYFAWASDRVLRSTVVEYIAYDLRTHDFFDWLKMMINEHKRYDEESLVEHFRKRFDDPLAR